MKKLKYLLVAMSLFFAFDAANAVPKSTPCKVFETDNCVAKSRVKKVIRNELPRNSKFLMSLQNYPIKAGTFEGFPSQTTVTPLVLIPAGTRTLTVCAFTAAGKFECTVLTAFNDCPRSIQIVDQTSRISYDCEVDCDNRRPNGDPDSNGNCDCDILYNTCEAIG